MTWGMAWALYRLRSIALWYVPCSAAQAEPMSGVADPSTKVARSRAQRYFAISRA